MAIVIENIIISLAIENDKKKKIISFSWYLDTIQLR